MVSDKRIKTVRLIWLEAFVALAKHGNYKEAGKELSLHPTLIKKFVVQLEEWLGKGLHFSFRNAITITEEGKEFIPKAATIIELMYTNRELVIGSDNIGDIKYVGQFLAKHIRKQGR